MTAELHAQVTLMETYLTNSIGLVQMHNISDTAYLTGTKCIIYACFHLHLHLVCSKETMVDLIK